MVELPDDGCVRPVCRAALDYKPVPWIRSADRTSARCARPPTCCCAPKRPLIWSGHGVLYAEASDELQRGRGAPGRARCMTTLMGKSGFDETPRAVGRHRRLQREPGAAPLPRCRRHAARRGLVAEPDARSRRRSRRARCSSTSPTTRATCTSVHATDVAVHADAKLFLAAAGGRAARARRRDGARAAGGDRGDDPRRVRAAWLAEYESLFAADGDAHPGLPDVPRAVVGARSRTRTILTHESGHSRATSSRCSGRRGRRARTSPGATRPSSGSRSGLAMGAKLAHPDKLVVNVMGDARGRHDRHGLGDGRRARTSRSSRSSSTTRSSRCMTSTSRSRSSGSALRTCTATTRASRGRWAATPSA